MQHFFDKYPEFINEDDRRDRSVSQITHKSYSNRHETALPRELIEGKSVLDLGSCIGATGHWCLSNGASYYAGVEVQEDAVKKSNDLLSKYWNNNQYYISNSDVNTYLSECIEDGIKFDIVVALGIIYSQIDYYSLLNKISLIAGSDIILDCRYPRMNDFDEKIIELNDKQFVHMQGSKTLNYSGAGVKIAPHALRLIMQSLGWDNGNRLLYPEPAFDSKNIDIYLTILNQPGTGIDLPTRYLTHFTKTNKVIFSAGNNTVTKNQKSIVLDNRNAHQVEEDIPRWEFDDTIAEKFQEEAEKHIPDYHNVINLSYNLINQAFPYVENTRILDVGSALGYTVDYFIKKGYLNTYGVEKSKSMVDRSVHRKHIFHSDSVPLNTNWDAIIANWTLHFIEQRHKYIQDIYSSLNPGGIFILTDKMDHTENMELMYYQFKYRNGVSFDEIEEKRKSLENILVTKPLKWYLSILEHLGFENIEVVNSRYMFYTIYAKKPS